MDETKSLALLSVGTWHTPSHFVLGIAGFSRLCPGDVFEIIIRHGSQKWKSRGLVNKDTTQTWENEFVIFRSLLGDILHVKVTCLYRHSHIVP